MTTLPKPQEKWMHWKGSVCTIVSTGKAIRSANELDPVFVVGGIKAVIAAGQINEGDPIVVYLHEETESLWARSLQNFMEILGDTDQIDGTMFSRFERQS